MKQIFYPAADISDSEENQTCVNFEDRECQTAIVAINWKCATQTKMADKYNEEFL